jgi:hypothetical protein
MSGGLIDFSGAQPFTANSATISVVSSPSLTGGAALALTNSSSVTSGSMFATDIFNVSASGAEPHAFYCLSLDPSGSRWGQHFFQWGLLELDEADDTYRDVYCMLNGSEFTLGNFWNYYEDWLEDSISVPLPEVDVWYWARIRQIGDTIGAAFWKYGDPEPEEDMASVTVVGAGLYDWRGVYANAPFGVGRTRTFDQFAWEPYDAGSNGVRARHASVWKPAQPFAKHDGVWRSPTKIYNRHAGVWKRSY